jgi:hypothetical protein
MAEINGGELPLQKQLQGFFTAMQDNLEQKQKDQLQGMILRVETLAQEIGSAVTKKDLEPIQKELSEVATKATQMMNDMKGNQEVIDKFVSDYNKRESKGDDKPFEDAWKGMITEMQSGQDRLKQFESKRGDKIGFELKTTMTVSNTITGGGVNDYNPRVGIVPPQQTNFRDLIPTVRTQNGLFVTYRETNSLQAFGTQTEGSSKTNVTYAFTAGTATLKYIAGQATFSKQLLFNLPFLNGSLPRLLIRDFYKKENDYFYDTVAAAATGDNLNTSATVDVEEVIAMIANQRNANFEASWGLVGWREWARLITTKPQDYSLPAGTVVNNQGTITIAGMPIIGASYAENDKILLWDRDYVERVEGESLRVEFSNENEDNFIKNLVTARCECFEEISLLRTDAVIYRDLGNSA